MSIKLSGSNDSEKLASLCQQTYKNQAIWFLNAFWDQFQGEAPKLWKIVSQCADLDAQRHGDGNGLDEVQAHRLLELLGETLTVVALRERLRKTGAIGQAERPKVVPLTHYILWRYEVDWHVLVNTSGDNSEEIEKAQKLLDEVSAAFAEAERQANLARQAEAHAKAQEAEAKAQEAEAKAREDQAKAREQEALAREADAREQEAPFKAAQEEVDAALADVNAQESARDNRTAELQRKSSEGGIVQQNKAKAELAQHLAEDPLPLRKAKITLEAALKRAEKARAPFEAATKVAEAARQEAEAARQVAEAARQVAEAARREAESARRQAEAQRQAAEESLDAAGQKVEEAEAYLAEVKAKPGSCHGAIWWMEKELEEQKKYLPSSKGGVAKRG